jgi:hypothetical protein
MRNKGKAPKKKLWKREDEIGDEKDKNAEDEEDVEDDVVEDYEE